MPHAGAPASSFPLLALRQTLVADLPIGGLDAGASPLRTEVSSAAGTSPAVSALPAPVPALAVGDQGVGGIEPSAVASLSDPSAAETSATAADPAASGAPAAKPDGGHFHILYLVPLFVIVGLLLCFALGGRAWSRVWHTREAAHKRKQRKDERRARRELERERAATRRRMREAWARDGYGDFPGGASPMLGSDDHSEDEKAAGPLHALRASLGHVERADAPAGRRGAPGGWLSSSLKHLTGWQGVSVQDDLDSAATRSGPTASRHQASGLSSAATPTGEDGQLYGGGAATLLNSTRFRGTWERIKKHFTSNIGWGYSGKAPGISTRRRIVAQAASEDETHYWTRIPFTSMAPPVLPHVQSGLLLPPQLPGTLSGRPALRPSDGPLPARARNRSRSFSPPALRAPPNTLRQIVASVGRVGNQVYDAVSGRKRGGRGQHQRLRTDDEEALGDDAPSLHAPPLHTHGNGRRCSLDEPQHLPAVQSNRTLPQPVSVEVDTALPNVPSAVRHSPTKASQPAFRPAPLPRFHTSIFDRTASPAPASLTRAETLPALPAFDTPMSVNDASVQRFVLTDGEPESPVIERSRSVRSAMPSGGNNEPAAAAIDSESDDGAQARSPQETRSPRDHPLQRLRTIQSQRRTPTRRRAPAQGSPVISPIQLRAPNPSYADLLDFAAEAENDAGDEDEEESVLDDEPLSPCTLPRLDSRVLARKRTLKLQDQAKEPAAEAREEPLLEAPSHTRWQSDSSTGSYDTRRGSSSSDVPSLVSCGNSSSEESSGVPSDAAPIDTDTLSRARGALHRAESFKSLHGAELVGEDFLTALAVLDASRVDPAIAEVSLVGAPAVHVTPRRGAVRTSTVATPPVKQSHSAVQSPATPQGRGKPAVHTTPTPQSPATPLGRSKTWTKTGGRWQCLEDAAPSQPSTPTAPLLASPLIASPRPLPTPPVSRGSPVRRAQASPHVASPSSPASLAACLSSPPRTAARQHSKLFMASPSRTRDTPRLALQEGRTALSLVDAADDASDAVASPGVGLASPSVGLASPKRRAAVARRPPKRYQAALASGDGSERSDSLVRTRSLGASSVASSCASPVPGRSRAGSEAGSQSGARLGTPREREERRLAAMSAVNSIIAEGLAQRQQSPSSPAYRASPAPFRLAPV